MKRRDKDILRTAIGVVAISCLWSNLAVAADDTRIETGDSPAVSSLKSVLDKAAKQGFVAIDSSKKPLADKELETIKNTQNLKVSQYGSVNCKIASALDLSIYHTVNSYEDISLTKSGIDNSEALSDVMPLIKTYMALGFGTEMIDLVRRYPDPSARLIKATGRVLEGYASGEDYAIISQFPDCNKAMHFWHKFAAISTSPVIQKNIAVELSNDDKDFLQDIPEHLRKIVTLRFGISAAENEDKLTAKTLLKALAPESRYGDVPALKDDGLLYLFGLVREMENDPAAQHIFKFLAERDGVYRVRALQKLAAKNLKDGTTPYDDFSNDLAAVSQQYNGQRESRQASLQVIKHRLSNDQFIDAIKQAKRDFKIIDSEQKEAVKFTADRIQERLKDKLDSYQIKALNAYFYDTDFFSIYEERRALMKAASNAAIDLNLPELVAAIYSPDTSELDEKELLAYADILIAAKRDDYETVIKLAKRHADIDEFQSLALEAALKSGNYKESIASLETRPADAERFALHSDVAWQNGHWGEAKIALEALANKEPSKAVTTKIKIANYIGIESRAYVSRSTPKTAVDLDLFKAQIDSDIALVKGYLSNG